MQTHDLIALLGSVWFWRVNVHCVNSALTFSLLSGELLLSSKGTISFYGSPTSCSYILGFVYDLVHGHRSALFKIFDEKNISQIWLRSAPTVLTYSLTVQLTQTDHDLLFQSKANCLVMDRPSCPLFWNPRVQPGDRWPFSTKCLKRVAQFVFVLADRRAVVWPSWNQSSSWGTCTLALPKHEILWFGSPIHSKGGAAPTSQPRSRLRVPTPTSSKKRYEVLCSYGHLSFWTIQRSAWYVHVWTLRAAFTSMDTAGTFFAIVALLSTSCFSENDIS